MTYLTTSEVVYKFYLDLAETVLQLSIAGTVSITVNCNERSDTLHNVVAA